MTGAGLHKKKLQQKNIVACKQGEWVGWRCWQRAQVVGCRRCAGFPLRCSMGLNAICINRGKFLCVSLVLGELCVGVEFLMHREGQLEHGRYPWIAEGGASFAA
jgi:hypothetical protein